MKHLGFFLIVATSFAGDWSCAEKLYRHTDYSASLRILLDLPNPGAPAYALIGKNQYMLHDYKKAIEAFSKASDLDPLNAEHQLWLGRSYGRKAETGSPFAASSTAVKARKFFESAVALDPNNQDALGDLFEFYLAAPAFLGGGHEKAAVLAVRIAQLNAAEGYSALARLAERKKQYDAADDHLRRAVAAAPLQAGRVLALATFLARQGRFAESDALFEQALKLAPNRPDVMFYKAQAYLDQKRNLDEARLLLEKYIKSDLTPDEPSRQEADKLLKQASALGKG